MKPISDFHIHTFYSGENGHAHGTIREIVEEARKKGFVEILITDHGPGHRSFGLKEEKIPEIRKEIDKLIEEYDDINILFGCEANIVGFSGKIDVSDEYKKYFDRINVGYHYGIWPRDLKFLYSFFIINNIAKIFPPLRNYARKLNTRVMINVVENNDIFTITHPSAKARVDIKELAEVCARNGTALEINSSGHGRLTGEDIMIALETDVKFTLGSDTHRIHGVGNLESSLERVKICGVAKERIINQFK